MHSTMLSTIYATVQSLFLPEEEWEDPAVGDLRQDTVDLSEDAEHLRSQIASCADRAGMLTAGVLWLVGLKAARELLGADWPQVEADINRVTSTMANRFIEPGEVALPHDEQTLLFGLQPGDPPQARMDAAADALQSALETQVPAIAGSIAVDHFVGEVPAANLHGATDLADCILSNLERIRCEVRSVGRDSSSLWMRGARLLFQPMWDPRSVATGPNRCALELAAGGSLALLTQSSDPDIIAEATARYDFIVLSKAIETLHAALQDGRPCRLLIPLHHLTIAGPWRGDYLKMCALVPRAYRRHVQVELIDLPASADGEDIARIRRRLGLLTDSLVVQINPARRSLDLAACGLDGISLSFAEMGRSHAGLAQALSGLTRFAHLSGLAAYATGVATIGQALAARDAGFNLIGGTAIHATLDVLRPPTRYSPLPNAARWAPCAAQLR